MQDLRYGVRTLLKHPGFTLIAVLTLAVGIGASTSIFSVVNAVLLNPLPYEEPDRLMMVWDSNAELGREHDGPSPGNFLDLQQQNGLFSSATAWFVTARTLTDAQDAEQVQCAQVSSNFFTTLRVRAASGRVFSTTDTQGVVMSLATQYVAGDRTVVVSDALWRRRYGGDPGLVGRQITINGVDWQVIGIMPAGFALPDREVDLWAPWDIPRTYAERFPTGMPRDFRFLHVVGRLQPGVTTEQARSQLDSFSAALAEQHPKSNRGWRMKLVPMLEEQVGKTRPMLGLLFAAVALVLVIVCANVVSLLLARGATRQREIAVRAALGASRARLVGQLLTESLLLAGLGGIGGLWLSSFGLDALIALAPEGIPRLDEVAIDRRVLLFTVAVSVLTGALVGLIPALRSSKTDLTIALKEGGNKGAAGGRSHRLRHTLVVAELAVALVLLAGAGLMMRSFARILAVDPGFDSRNLLTMHISLNGAAYGQGKSAIYYQQLIQRLQSLPSVVSAAAVTTLPMSKAGVDFDRPYWRAGEAEPGGEADKAAIRMATPEYFGTIGIPILAGRNFTAQDRRETPAVIVVSESFARKVWPDGQAIGRQLMLDYNRGKYAYQVVGITRDIRYYGLKSEPKPEVFIPHAQNAYLPMNVIVRTAADPMQMLGAVRQEVRALDPAQPVSRVDTMERLVARWIAPDRFSLWLLGLLAVIALLLAAVGIYGVLSFTVSQRTQEIGVRMALGARKEDVLKLVVGQGLQLVAIGVAIGLAGASALTRLMKTLLFGVSATDPATFVIVALLLAFVTLFACWLPARRAAKVDPITALRQE